MVTCIYKSGVNCSILAARNDQNCEFMNPVQKKSRYYNYRKGREEGKGRKRKEKEGKVREGKGRKEELLMLSSYITNLM